MAVATNRLGRTLKRRRLISCDIGGTSTDTSLILDNEIPAVDETDVNYLPIKTPTVDVQCIGAGGGSIAYVDSGGALRVGPESAGASPGPACYGAGGKHPTLTDANLLLGRLSNQQFCGGQMRLLPFRCRKEHGGNRPHIWMESRKCRERDQPDRNCEHR